MDRGAWGATVSGAAKSQTYLSITGRGSVFCLFLLHFLFCRGLGGLPQAWPSPGSDLLCWGDMLLLDLTE